MSATATDHPFSVPRYPSGQPNLTANTHLLVTQGPGRDDCAALAAQLGKARLTHLARPDFPSLAALQLALGAQLKDARVGLRLDLRGDEAFVWPLHALARAAGLQVDEILMSSSPQGTRQVFCVHCATCQPASSTTHLTCAQCGVVLEVRRHFSQRLGAYLGVCADADQPYQEVRP
ncbi:dimethylamine monooxygenase subunit DmmA family protein [Pseudomonas sp. CR3202]|uniref:dimethylamine monooxygenase subunit DmmA family protein n=1 Tax=Pseudomonas sp. CR3202 TaxID=3351532 RepID=UPI003BEF7564